MEQFEEPKSRLLEQDHLSDLERKRLQRESNETLARFRKKACLLYTSDAADE